MMVIRAAAAREESQIGVVLSRLFGCNMKDGSIGKFRRTALPRAVTGAPCSAWTMICG